MTRAELILFLVCLVAAAAVFGLEWRAARRRRRENVEWMRRYYEYDGRDDD